MMTKQEEREALAKIEQILQAAGPDSYIGMAFAGCCEIARYNIENDFGVSMQDNIDTWRRNAGAEHDMRIRAEDECETLRRAVARKADEIQSLRQQLKAERAKQIPADLYKLAWLAINDHIEQAENRIEGCVEILANFADNPNDIAVAEALKRLREAHARKAKYTELLDQFDAYEPKEG